jgi:NAD(P)-dependent dehydrogenase (short-subunit alcohol dehydrogenase family)
MKIIVVGASGAVGSTAVQSLSSRHQIIGVGRSSGDVRADMNDTNSIRAMYRQIGKADAVVSAVGTVRFGPTDHMTGKDFRACILGKVLPQVQLVLEGISYLNNGGSFTLTSGVSNRDPIAGGSAAGAANGALDGFVVGAAVDMPRSIRINAVSPEALEVSRGKHPERFLGHAHVSDEAVGLAYSKSVEGCLTGQIFIVD